MDAGSVTDRSIGPILAKGLRTRDSDMYMSVHDLQYAATAAVRH